MGNITCRVTESRCLCAVCACSLSLSVCLSLSLDLFLFLFLFLSLSLSLIHTSTNTSSSLSSLSARVRTTVVWHVADPTRKYIGGFTAEGIDFYGNTLLSLGASQEAHDADTSSSPTFVTPEGKRRYQTQSDTPCNAKHNLTPPAMQTHLCVCVAKLINQCHLMTVRAPLFQHTTLCVARARAPNTI